jgi:hypothetical protein
MNLKYGWQELYRSALLELQVEDLERRIGLADQAIRKRMVELRGDDSGAEHERQALGDALRMLRFLAITECKTPDPAAPGATSEQATS